MSEWKEYRLGELIEEIAMGPFGSNIKVECFVHKGVPVLNGSNLQGFKLNESAFNYVTPEKADSLGRANAFRGDVVITHRGTLGQIIYIPEDSIYERYIISQSQFRVKFKKEVDPQFIVYFFHSRAGQHLLLTNASQVGVPAIARPSTSFKELKAILPPLSEQKKIAAILSSLDEKIENNRKINARLEELAQAIFKSWFIDFEPFGGKMPEDWANFKVGEVSTINERQYSLYENWTDFQYLDTGNITENIIGKLYKFSNNNDLPSRARRKVKEFDIIYSTVRPNQRHFGLILNPDKNWLVSTGFAVISAKQSYINSFYLYMVISQKKVSEYLQSLGEQATSTYPSVNATDIANLEIMVPDLELQNQFGLIISKIFQLKNTLEQESSRLAALRDTLLPKLMSGELIPE